MRLYRKLEGDDLKEGVPVQYLGVYVLRWPRALGEPQCAFVEDEDVIGVHRQLAWDRRGGGSYGQLGRLLVACVHYSLLARDSSAPWHIDFRLPGITPPLGRAWATEADAQAQAQVMLDQWFMLVTSERSEGTDDKDKGTGETEGTSKDKGHRPQ